MEMKELIGKDRMMGKPIRLNSHRLEPKSGREYAELLFCGDWHYGHPCCDLCRVKKMLSYCHDNGIYVLGMGDYLEAGLRDSVGDSVYLQELNPQDQMEDVIALFEPIAKAGLLLGLHIGNHEARILKNTSVNLVKIMAKQLAVPYLGDACWSIFYVGSQSYTAYTLHGSTGS